MFRFFELINLNVDELLEEMKNTYQVIKLLERDFNNAVKTAYANGTTKTDEGNIYNINDKDYEACEIIQVQIEQAITRMNMKLKCSIKIMKGVEKDVFQHKALSMGQEILSIRNQSRKELSGHLTGLKYCKDYPTPEDRLSYEFRNEGEMCKNMLYR